MKLILHYLKNYKLLFFINVLSVFGFALVELGIPTIVAQMIDVGVMQQDQDYIYQMGHSGGSRNNSFRLLLCKNIDGDHKRYP